MTSYGQRTTTARDALYLFLELAGLTPDLSDWTERRLSKNPPRLIRLRQLMALFRAFEIAWDPWVFTEGKFIDVDSGRYDSILDRLAAELNRAYGSDGDVDAESGPPDDILSLLHYSRRFTRVDGSWSGTQLQFHISSFFQSLFWYRERVDRVLRHADSVYEASGAFAFAHRRIHEVNQVIRDNIGTIDEWLTPFISPEERVFTRAQLIREFNYPDVDLRDIDFEWA